MRKIHLLAHISLDGFVADENRSFDHFPGGEGSLSFVNELTKLADATLMGRISYELLNHHWPSRMYDPSANDDEVQYSTWYNKAEKYIVSGTLRQENQDELTTIIKLDIAEKLRAIKQQPGKDILIFGSPTLLKYLDAHSLVDDYWIFINPVTFGNGIPLFSQSPVVRKFTLESTRQFPNGELVMHYLPV